MTKLVITVKSLPYAARTRARTDANVRGLLHTKPTKLATLKERIIWDFGRQYGLD